VGCDYLSCRDRRGESSKLKQAWHITLPSIRPLIILLFVLSISNILNTDFTQLIALVGNNYALYEVGDVIDTFVYRDGVLNCNYGFTTAIGFFKGIISLVLIVTANKLVKVFGEDGIF
jgi:putative aldouronate transport system permease protein